jgi:DNA-binding NarL/FixJ family response regulator
MHENLTFAERTLTAGAVGFVLKDTADDDLVELSATPREASSTSAHALQDVRSCGSECAAHGALTTRDTELLRLIALGHTSVRSPTG